MPLLCPRDRSSMESEAVGRVVIDRCGRCGGIWLDAGELESLVKDGPGGALWADIGPAVQSRTRAQLGALLCPRDGRELQAVEHDQQKHVEVDRCARCRGMFLDVGELADLSEFTLRERVAAVLTQR